MKSFFSRNRKVVEIFLTLLLVFLTAGYYYLIYIPARENEIIERRFRTLQRIEDNMQEKFQGYISTIKNCFAKADECFFREMVKGYNSDPDKFLLKIVKEDTITKDKKNYDSSRALLDDDRFESYTVKPTPNGKKITITYDWYKSNGKTQDTIKHITVKATIDYKEFVVPLLRKNVFDHYIVFNVGGDSSNIVYEDFRSGVSFNNVDSLFGSKKKVYTSRIVTIETGGEKYLAFLQPYGYNRKNDRIIAGLLMQGTFDKEKRQLPESMVTTILFIALFSFLLLPVIRLTLMGKKERIRFFDLFAGYFSFLLLVPVIILVFFWNNLHFQATGKSRIDSKKVLADQISRSLNNEIDSAYALLDEIDSLYYSLSILDTVNVNHLNKVAAAHNFECDTSKNTSINILINARIDTAVKKLQSAIEKDSTRYKNVEFVFWMDSTGKEVANWAFEEDPPRGNYKDRNYFKKVQDNDLISSESNPHKNYVLDQVISRIDGKFKVVISKKSRKGKFVVACPSRFRSVINPVLPMGYDFSITDAAGNTIFDADTTDNLNENLLDEFTNPASFKVALDTKTSVEFKTRYEDEESSVLAQPIPGLSYFIVISESGAFDSSLKTQCFAFTLVMMFSFFLFLCVEIIIVFIAHYQQTKLLKNKFDLSWIHPHKSMCCKYFFILLFNVCLLIVLAFFCFTGFSIGRLTEYIFLFIMASLLSSIAACAFKADKTTPESSEERTLRRKKITMIALSVLGIVALISSVHYSVYITLKILLFSAISFLLFIMLSRFSRLIKGTNYLMNFRLMIFSKLLLTSGLPVIVFFICIYNFEQRLEERLKLHDYAENIEQHAKNKGDLQAIVHQINEPNAIKAFYTDAVWIAHVGYGKSPDVETTPPYTYADSVCIRLLKTSRVHYNDVSGTTENFELLKPFRADSNQFAFNSIFKDSVNTLKYRVTEIFGDSIRSAIQNYITLSSSGTKTYTPPSIFTFPEGFIFWIFLFAGLAICYQLLKYAINKVFGINIPGIEDFKTMHENLLVDENIKYLFVQGIPGSDKTSFVKRHLEADKKFTFYDKANPQKGGSAIIFNLEEIPDEEEIENEKAVFEKEPDRSKLKSNWYYKVSALDDEQIKCIVFTHFEYKILDEHTNRIKLNLIEKIIPAGKRKIIITSDIDPVEYFQSFKKSMYSFSGNKDQNADPKKNSKESGNEKDANAAFFEYMNRWNNLLGKFTNIYTDNNASAATEYSADTFSKEFLATECSHPLFLNKYKPQFEAISDEKENVEDNILKIQNLSDHSYRQIWASLTKEEQITLYDLAEDGLMNTTNYMSLTRLLNKGLVIKKDGVLMLMNHSFRNFVLTVVNTGELKKIEKEINDDQSWSDYKYPVLIILGALVYFVLSSNPEKFGNVLPLISGLMAGIPTVLKLLSYMKPGESKG